MTISLDPRKTADFDVVNAVRDATEKATTTRKKAARFSLTRATPGETATAIIFGIYLAYAVARLPEVFETLAIPRLPMIMMLLFMAILAFTVPPATWAKLWEESPPIRYVTYLAGLGLATVPLGIWSSGAFYYFRSRYVIALGVFYCAVVFLRDRANLRRAIAIYVLCVSAVSIRTVVTFDPQVIEYDENGVLIEHAQVNGNQRVSVGDSLDPNDFGAILAVTFPMALWLGVGGAGRRIFWSAIAITMVLAVVLTASRGALLGFGAVATVLIGIGARGWRRFLTILMVGVGILAFLYTANSGQMDRFTDFSTSDYNLTSEGRWHFWKQGMIWMVKRPLGYGLDNYVTYFDWLNGGERSAHSAWVQYGVELGVAGLVIYVLLCVGLVRGLLRLRQRAIAARSLADESLAGHLVAMLTGLMVTGTFLSIAYYPLTYMAIGIAAAALIGTTLPDLPAATTAPATPQPTGRRGPPAVAVARRG